MSETEPKKAGMAGGFFIAAGLLGGTIIGVYVGQASVGMVTGLALGVAAALLVWFLDRGK